MRFVLTPVGSGGDVHPYLGLGRELKIRGHEVIVIVNEAFQRSVEREGLGFVPFGTEEDYLKITEDPDLWHPQKGFRVILSRLSEELQTGYELIESVYEPGRTILVGHTLALATRAFEETHDAPAATIHLSPTVFRSDFDQPTLIPGMNLSRLPGFLKRFLWSATDRIMIDPVIAKPLNHWRASLGLPPVSRVFHSWIHSPNRLIGFFPDWFAPRQPDWPEQLRLTGFPLFDDPGESGSDPELERWIEGGDPPVVFTPGTANRHATSFFAAAVAALERLGRRGLFLTNFEEHLPEIDGVNVRHAAYIPFSEVLPRCAAIVHHGGVGTMAQGLAAGIPQLVMPMGFDQPDNAARLVTLGVGSWLTPKRFTGERLARALGRLVDDSAVTEACRRTRARVANDDGIALACEEIEALG